MVLPGRKLYALLLATVLSGSLAACSAEGTPRDAAPSIAVDATSPSDDELVALLEEVRRAADAPGAILAVASRGEPVRLAATGLADLETGAEMTADLPYFQGSATKTYTAAAVLRLIERGRLSLDDRVSRFLPSFPDGERIEVRHLLAQTSGLKDFYLYFYLRPDRDEMIDFVTRRWSRDELIGFAGRFGSYFEPGAGWDYSSTNYFLLGVIVEAVAGRPLAEVFRADLLAPLGLERTWIHEHETPRGRVPTGYLGRVEAWKHSEMFGELGPTTLLDRSSAEWAAGGLIAPAAEAVAFLRALFDGELLAPSSLEAMTTFRDTPRLGFAAPDATDPGKKDGYGLGLVRMERPGFTLLGHGGLFNGHTAGLWHLPECGLTFALYLNRGFVDQRAALDRLLPTLTRSADGASRCAAGAGPA